MITIDSVVKYSDVKTGILAIHVGDKVKKYRAIWFAYLAGVVNGQNTLPAGVYPIRFKLHGGNINAPFVCFNKVFKVPIEPLGNRTYAQLQPFFYVQHTDGSMVSNDEWKQVCSIMALYVSKFTLAADTVDVSPKEFMDKSSQYDLENW